MEGEFEVVTSEGFRFLTRGLAWKVSFLWISWVK